MQLGEILVSEAEISQAIARFSTQIIRDYDLSNLVLVGVMDGAISFLADLMRTFETPLHMATVRTRSYTGTELGALTVDWLPTRDRIEGRDVLIVEDILDTGATRELFTQKLLNLGVVSVKVCTLLDKPSRRTHDIAADYSGFEAPDVFVVGYGLDYNGKYRNLRDVHMFRE